MSQIGTVLSAAPLLMPGNDWLILFSYNTDAGQAQQAEIVVGNTTAGFTGAPPTVPFWASASSTVSVPSAPGTSNVPILIPCPDIIKVSAFGQSIKGFPIS